MRTPRVLVPAASPGKILELPAAEAHHLARVLRRKPGDDVVALAACGGLFGAVVEEVESRGTALRVTLRIGEPVEEEPRILPWTVAVALVKGRAVDLAVRLASELGLEGLDPLLCERSQVPGDRSRGPERWRRIALEAAKQCGRSEPLRIGAPRSVRQILDESPLERRWIAQPGAPRPAPEDLSRAGEALPSLFLVGPEGGFTDDELLEAGRAGARPIGFPVPVMRSATAVVLIAALGVVVGDIPGSGTAGEKCG